MKTVLARTVMNLVVVTCVVTFCVVLLCSAGVDAQTSLQAFSADEQHTVKTAPSLPAGTPAQTTTTTGKIYGSANAVRTEMKAEGDGRESITIVRLDRNVAYRLDVLNHGDIEWPYADDTGASGAEFASYLPGAAVERQTLGSEQIAGYPCKKWRVQVTFKGHVYTSLEWAAPELQNFVVRRQGEHGEWSSQYSNIRFGAQKPELFEVPTGYQAIKFSRDWTPTLEQMTATLNHGDSISIARAAGLKIVGDDPSFHNRESQPATDTYSVSAVDPVTGVTVWGVTTYVDYFPKPQRPAPGPPESGPIEPKVLAVQRSAAGSDWLLHVSFIVPDAPQFSAELITVYGMQMVGTQRLHDQNYPSVHGHWKPNERVEFSVRVPKECADAAKGWDLTFCVGTPAGCYPSANLLKLIAETGRKTP
jgi:hypothetical protein